MRDKDLKVEFYDDFFSIEPFSETNDSNLFKDRFIRSMMKNGKIYKFVAFTSDENLNSKKLIMLQNHQFWASCYDYFEDKREVLRPYNKYKVQYRTRKSQNQLDFFFSTVNEMNDISCFTYDPSNFMWQEYANNGNGFCMEFDLEDSDKFFPVIYLDKDKLDYTNEIIRSFKNKSLDFKTIGKLAILPWVTKDFEYQREHELRFLCGDIYNDEQGPMGGRIAPGKKKLLGYKGIEYSFDYAGLVLKKVTIGPNCAKEKELIDICEQMDVLTEKL